MAKSRKFGTFGGVFTPAILTILGVIMYMRLPWVVGNGGMWMTIGVVLVAHVVSLTTGLSVSSMSTDKRVKAGGSYYILSRSLGLPIGGTLGIALFVGLSFSISLYVIGFSESFLGYFDQELSTDNIRVVGSAVLALVAGVTLISTALAIKTQFFIMAAIAVSLASILIGSDQPAPELMHVDPLTQGISFAVLFGIFFPAVTGFEAGVSMSGDLKDPKRSIPVGTMVAIVVGLVVYVSLTVFLAWRIPAEQLANNPRVLLDYAWMEELVVPGIWGATISSALGSILGAPRILQAVSADGIGPRFFERGRGPSNEPRNALLLTTFLAWGGVLVGELDTIARVVSMFFLTSYGFLNLAAFIESWVSPDFRPDFRIPRTVSLIGAVTCIVLMVQLDIAAMVGATLAMGLLYFLLKRRELALEGGDTWSGVWAALVRWSLSQLSRSDEHERNWRPHIISFGGDNVRPLVEHLAGRGGLFSDLTETTDNGANTWNARLQACRFHGLPGLIPNTVVLSLDDILAAPGPALEFLNDLDRDRFNVLVAPGRAAIVPGRIDIWWRGRGGSLALALALVRSVTATRPWRRAGVRFHLPIANAAERRIVERRISHWLEQARVHADIRSVDPGVMPPIERLSADAAITFLGLPGDTDPARWAERLREITRDLPNCLLVRPSDAFKNPLGDAPVTGTVTDAVAPVRVEREDELLEDPVLAQIVDEIEVGLADALTQPLLHGDRELFASLVEIAGELEETGDLALRRLARLRAQSGQTGEVAARIRSGALASLAELATRAGTSETAHQQWLLAAAAAADRALGEVVLSTFREVRVKRVELDGKNQVVMAEGRVDRLFRGRTLYLQADLAELVGTVAPDAVTASFQRLLAARLQHITALHSLSLSLAESITSGEDEAKDWRDEFRGWREAMNTTIRTEKAAAEGVARSIAESLAERIVSAPRRLPQRAASVANWLDAEEISSHLAPRLAAVDETLQLTRLELRMVVVNQRLRGGIDEALGRVHERLELGVLSDLRTLRRAIEDASMSDLPVSRRRGDFDAGPVLLDISRTVESAVAEVPDTVRIVPDIVLARIEADTDIDEADIQNIAVRQLVGYLLETELVAGSREEARALERAARRAEDLLRDATSFAGDLPAHSGAADFDVAANVEELRERITEVEEHLVAEEEKFRRSITRRVDEVVGRLAGAQLVSEASGLSRFVRTQKQRRFILSAMRSVSRWRDAASRKLVDTALRWDAGWVAARAAERKVERTLSEELVEFRDRVAPSPAVLDALPVFYRRAFTAQTIDPELIVGGTREMTAAAEALERYAAGAHGAILITGPPGAGASTMTRRILREYLATRHVVEIGAPSAATSSIEAFEAAVAAAVRGSNTRSLEASLRGLPHGAVIVVHDLELWWQRHEDGLEVLERLHEIIEMFSSRFLFLLTANHATADLLRRLEVVAPTLIGRIRVRELVAAQAMDAVLRRHGAAGLELRFADGSVAGDLALARYFSGIRELTGGAAGSVHSAWLAHIQEVDSEAIVLKPRTATSLDAFNKLPVDWIPLVSAVALHRRLDDAHITALLGADAVAAATTLARAGLFTRRDGVTQLDRVVRPYAVQWLTEQGVLG